MVLVHFELASTAVAAGLMRVSHQRSIPVHYATVGLDRQAGFSQPRALRHFQGSLDILFVYFTFLCFGLAVIHWYCLDQAFKCDTESDAAQCLWTLSAREMPSSWAFWEVLKRGRLLCCVSIPSPGTLSCLLV